VGLGRRREQRLVQQFIAQPAVEALDGGILHGFARRDVVPVDTALVSPAEDGVAGELAAVVADRHLRLAALHHQPLQLARDAGAGERGVGHQPQALAGAIVDDGEDAEAAAIGKLIRHEVKRPASFGATVIGARVQSPACGVAPQAFLPGRAGTASCG